MTTSTDQSVFARVQDGRILEYPVTMEFILNRNAPLSMFRQVNFQDKPPMEPFHLLTEELQLINGQPTVVYGQVPMTLQQVLDDLWADKETVEVADVPQATFAKVIALTREIVGVRLDEFAKTRDYDNIISLCSYATDPDEVHGAEGQRGVVLRSRSWTAIRGYERDVSTGAKPVPRQDVDILSVLPNLTWED